MQGALPYFDSLDSDQVCKIIFPEDDPRRVVCQTQISGIISKGFTNTIQYSLQKLQQAHIDFLNHGEAGTRDAAYLKS